MSATTETAMLAYEARGLWIHGLDRTDPEFWHALRQSWARYIPTSLPRVQAETGTKRYVWFENSTSPHERPEEIDHQIEALFEAAKEQIFEDGIETEFSKELVSLVKRYGNVAIEVMAHLIVHERVNADVASEALRWLGRIEHAPSCRYRLWLLERSLRCFSARIRDGAALGLASMDDPNAIPHLKQAIQAERVGELREDMVQVLTQLESTYRCHVS